MSASLISSGPLPQALTQSPLKIGEIYTVRVALRVPHCKDRCLKGDLHGNTSLGTTREITNGTRLELHHHDTRTDTAFCTIYGETAVRVPSQYLIPWN